MKKKKLSDEALFDRGEDISLAVHKVVDQMTADLTEEDDYDIRQRLTEQFRFWRNTR